MKTETSDNVIVKEAFFPHPIGKVWSAISNADQISQWFIKADFKPDVGYEYTFTHEQTVVKGKVLEADPVTNLLYTWTVCGTEPELNTEVRWSLEEKTDGTKLTITHTGFESYDKNSVAAFFSATEKGWDAVMVELAGYLN